MSNPSLTYEEACTILKVSPQDHEDTVKHTYRKLRARWHPDLNTAPDAQSQFEKIQLAFAVWEKGPILAKVSPTHRVYKQATPKKAQHYPFYQKDITPTQLIKKTKPHMDVIHIQRKFHMHELLQEHAITVHDMSWKECVHCKATGCTTCNYQGYKSVPWTRIIQLPRETNWSKPYIQYVDDREIQIHVTILDHDFYKLENHDLHGVLEITCLTAMVGTTADIQTLDGTQNLDIPPGTQPGQIFYIRNQGLFREDGSRGNIVLKAHVTIPAVQHTEIAQKIYELEKIIERPSLLNKKKPWWHLG